MAFWLNGEFRDETAAIDISDRGLLLGDGVFETMLLEAGESVLCARHLERLRAGAAALGIPVPFTDDCLIAAIRDLAARNAIAGAGAARLTLTRGSGGRGLAFSEPPTPPTALLTAVAYAPPSGECRLIVSASRRNEFSIAARCKTLNYLDNVLARNEAAAAGADEAVMLNAAGRVACASAANLYAIRDGVVMTPPVSDGALPGVVRAILLRDGAAAGVVIREASLTLEDLAPSALFVTNSLIGLRAARLEGAPEASAGAREIFARLKSCYADAIKREAATRR